MKHYMHVKPLQTVIKCLSKKRPPLVNMKNVSLPHENARRSLVRITQETSIVCSIPTAIFTWLFINRLLHFDRILMEHAFSDENQLYENLCASKTSVLNSSSLLMLHVFTQDLITSLITPIKSNSQLISKINYNLLLTRSKVRLVNFNACEKKLISINHLSDHFLPFMADANLHASDFPGSHSRLGPISLYLIHWEL